MNVKTYNAVGTSNLNGIVKPRFANGASARCTTLIKNGHEDVKLKQLEAQLDKNNALRFLLNNADFEEEQAEIEEYACKNSKQIKKEIEEKQNTTALVVKNVHTKNKRKTHAQNINFALAQNAKQLKNKTSAKQNKRKTTKSKKQAQNNKK